MSGEMGWGQWRVCLGRWGQGCFNQELKNGPDLRVDGRQQGSLKPCLHLAYVHLHYSFLRALAALAGSGRGSSWNQGKKTERIRKLMECLSPQSRNVSRR